MRLACLAAMRISSVVAFEERRRKVEIAHIVAMRAVLEAVGIEFTDGDMPDVALRRGAA